MAATRDLLTGIAELLAASGLGLSWNPAGVYPAGQTGIFMLFTPTAPDRCVVLNLVDRADDPSMPLGEKMLQVRGRGNRNDPLDVADLLDPIFDTLHGRTNLVIGGQTIIQILRRTSAPMGTDDSVRFERADQYYLDVDAAPTAIRPAGGSW
ncbi:minor capsid protein [Microbacterium allomyrinae]|uniref:Uncharacterized protein n=1 Tax=Microbacterium allomyrinae TaxID=2830666 RepID=A0A9X1LWS5_9MICO|nr:minor capsid protein [Microbacterium allomyrinae]MCC2033068.1 hypothetical protein [Microbacterium allomyrinae]